MDILSWMFRKSVMLFTVLFDICVLAIIINVRHMVDATPDGFMHYFAYGMSIMLMVLVGGSILWFTYDLFTKNLGTNYKR
jgi:hypothetical protein